MCTHPLLTQQTGTRSIRCSFCLGAHGSTPMSHSKAIHLPLDTASLKVLGRFGERSNRKAHPPWISRVKVGLDDLTGLFQPNWFYDSTMWKQPWHSVLLSSFSLLWLWLEGGSWKDCFCGTQERKAKCSGLPCPVLRQFKEIRHSLGTPGPQRRSSPSHSFSFR